MKPRTRGVKYSSELLMEVLQKEPTAQRSSEMLLCGIVRPTAGLGNLRKGDAMKAIAAALLMFATTSGSAYAQSVTEEIRQLRWSLEFEAEMARYERETERIRRETAKLREQTELANLSGSACGATWKTAMEITDGALEIQRGEMWSEGLTLGLAVIDNLRKAQRQRPLTGKARATMVHALLCAMPSYAVRHQSVGGPVTDNGQRYDVPACVP
jgi:hypothetical protein